MRLKLCPMVTNLTKPPNVSPVTVLMRRLQAAFFIFAAAVLTACKVASEGLIVPSEPETWARLETERQDIRMRVLQIGPDESTAMGGAIAVYDDALIIAASDGTIRAVLPGQAEIDVLQPRIPMALGARDDDPVWQSRLLNRSLFGVADLLVVNGTTDWLYATHEVYVEGQMCARLSRTELSRGRPLRLGFWETVYTVDPCLRLDGPIHSFRDLMSGGRLVVEGDGNLLMSVGDFGFGMRSPERFTNGRSGDWGTILSIDPERGTRRVLATGLRNVRGLAPDATGQIWSTEYGPTRGGEVNVILAGQNYGWPQVSAGTGYAAIGLRPEPMPGDAQLGSHGEFAGPALAVVPPMGLRQMLFLDGDTAFDNWAGDALIAGKGARAVLRIRREGEVIVETERIPIGERVHDLVSFPNGTIALLADRNRLVLLALDDHVEAHPFDVSRRFEPQIFNDRELFRHHCADCHSFGGVSGFGPSLDSLDGREVGKVGGYPYSEVLRSSDAAWDPDLLRDYLRDPGAVGLNGTTMPAVELTPKERARIVDFVMRRSDAR